MSEQWKDVVGYEGIYQVSDLGRIRRVAPGPGAVVGRILRTAIAGKGYLQVMLYCNGDGRRHYVHRLVAEAFLPRSPGKNEINHKNGIKADNRVANLEWVTHSENLKHASSVLSAMPKGEEHPNSVLNRQDVKQVRRLHDMGDHTREELGKMFGTSPSNIGRIVRGETWQHVGGPIIAHACGPLCGEANACAKLTDPDVRLIRRLYDKGGRTQQELAEIFGVSPSNISFIVRRETWKHVS